MSDGKGYVQYSLIFNSTQLERVVGGFVVCAQGANIDKYLISGYSLYKNIGERQISSSTDQSASVVLESWSEEKNGFDCSGIDD